MSLQELFRSKEQLAQFEKAARAQGFHQFSKRGGFYCHSDLNTYAAGYLVGLKETPIPAPCAIDLDRVASCI